MEDGHFICAERDCNLRFSSEYSLQNHKKRHEMVLSLNKSNLPSSDQTPTPVRFIRQCEEIGLFQDLQNVNPFEETFRKAAEAVKKGAPTKQQSLSVLNHATSEDLHTPHIFPDEINIESSIQAGTRSNGEKIVEEEEVVIRSEADTSLKATNLSQQHLSPPVANDRVSTTVTAIDPIVRNRPFLLDSLSTGEVQRLTALPNFDSNALLAAESALSTSIDPVQVLLRMPNGSLVQLATKPVTNTTIVPVNIAPAPLQLEETVKVLPRTCATNGGTVILATQSIQRPVEPAPTAHRVTTTDVKQKLKQLLGGTSKIAKQHGSLQKTVSVANKSDNAPAKKTSRNDDEANMDESEKEKRRKILERNRKAAIRCRERRKRWVEELRKRADAMAVTNRTLTDEIRCLKAEVANLRTLLLAHANCPVTLAQTAANICISNERTEVANKRPRRDGLKLDIEQATRAASVASSIDLDTPTPTIVRSDKVLSSVAPPATPEQDRLVTFTDILSQDRNSEINEVIVGEKHLTTSTSISGGGTTTVIQINPNAIRPSPHGFS